MVKLYSFFIAFYFSMILQNDTLPDYKNSNIETEKRVEDLLSRMTLKEKIEQLSGRGFKTGYNERLDIPAFHLADGPVGVRRDSATAFPAAIALASTWDTTLIKNVGKAMAKEAKDKGINFLLGPCVNIHRIPNGGRNFESYGEDPFLNGKIAASMVKGIQSEKVLSSVKHFACNNHERDRFDHDIIVDERTLREIYLPPYKAAVQEGGTWTVMAAYNKVNGVHCTENEFLINKVLRKDWGFDGFVVSDWGASKNTVPSIKAGLNLEMPWHARYWWEKVVEQIEKGNVTEEEIDNLLMPILRIKFRAGLFENETKEQNNPLVYKKNRELALEAAIKSIVLLKNERNILPFDRTQVKSIAVIGQNAKNTPTGGGGSSHVTPFYKISGLEGIQEEFGKSCDIHFANGYRLDDELEAIPSKYLHTLIDGEIKHGLHAEYFDNNNLEGMAAFKQIDPEINFHWKKNNKPFHDSIKGYSVRWSGFLTAPESGEYKLDIQHKGAGKLFLDDELIAEAWYRHPLYSKFKWIKLEKGKKYNIQFDYACLIGNGFAKLAWIKKNEYDKRMDERIENAKNIAQKSDVAIVFAGLNEEYEIEGLDKDESLSLPCQQERLINEIANINPNTIVVLTNGSAICTQNWAHNIPAVIETWYLGQESGNAIAGILSGKYNPTGKLTCSFPAEANHLPQLIHYDENIKEIQYNEGIFVGYRYLDKHNHEPAFPFGHGLSYTRFRYSGLKILKKDKYLFVVNFKVKNTGEYEGSEIVQLYIHDKKSSVERPFKELKGFEKIKLQVGESKQVEIPLENGVFSFFCPNSKEWVIEPGEFDVMIGSSSKDIRLADKILIQ